MEAVLDGRMRFDRYNRADGRPLFRDSGPLSWFADLFAIIAQAAPAHVKPLASGLSELSGAVLAAQQAGGAMPGQLVADPSEVDLTSRFILGLPIPAATPAQVARLASRIGAPVEATKAAVDAAAPRPAGGAAASAAPLLAGAAALGALLLRG
jgi:hypothetical protein